MRKLLIAAAMLTAFTGLANAQAGAQTSSKPEEKQTTPIEISKQSGTASGARGDTGTRGSDSDSSNTGRTRSPDIAYGEPGAGGTVHTNKTSGMKKKASKHGASKATSTPATH